MDTFDDIGSCQIKQIMQSLYILVPILESLAAISRFIQLMLLDHRSHRAVDDQDPLLKCFEKSAHKQKTPRCGAVANANSCRLFSFF